MFHIGVHNLPPEEARALEAGMAIVTADPRSERVAEMLAAMHAMKDVLLVLNHPFRSEERVEAANTSACCESFWRSSERGSTRWN